MRDLSVVLCHFPAAAQRQEDRHLIIRNCALELRQRLLCGGERSLRIDHVQ